MKYLIDTTEIYRVDSEAEADQLLETAKASGVLNKYSCVYKERSKKAKLQILGIELLSTKNLPTKRTQLPKLLYLIRRNNIW